MKKLKNFLFWYINNIVKWGLTWLWFCFWILISLLWLSAFDWSWVSNVNSGTLLTPSIWNTTMNTITWAIEWLESNVTSINNSISSMSWKLENVVYTSWDQTINGEKIFTWSIKWKVPISNDDLANKAYVDWAINASVGAWGWWAWAPVLLLSGSKTTWFSDEDINKVLESFSKWYNLKFVCKAGTLWGHSFDINFIGSSKSSDNTYYNYLYFHSEDWGFDSLSEGYRFYVIKSSPTTISSIEFSYNYFTWPTPSLRFINVGGCSSYSVFQL